MHRYLRKPRQSTLFAAVVILAVSRIIFNFDPLGSVLDKVSTPVRSAIAGVGLNNGDNNLDEYQDRFDADQLTELKNENTKLKEQLGLQEEVSAEDYQNAEVIGSSLESFQRRVIINKGTSDGVEEGMSVTAFNYLIGRVVKTSPDSSEVMLINDSQFRAAVKIDGYDIDALLTNTSAGTVITQVPESVELSSGDLVKTSGLGRIFESGLLTGQIGGEISNGQSIFTSYNLRLPINPNNIDFVQIILDKDSN